MRHYIDQACEEIRAQVGKERVLLGLSGGVDSSVAAALLHKAIGDQLPASLSTTACAQRRARKGAGGLRPPFQAQAAIRGRLRAFFCALKGVTDPERKRKIIGKTFIEVFQRATKRAGAAKFLAQGTLYPDVIESVPIGGNPAALIKSHHNVGGLPKNMKFKLVEPLRSSSRTRCGSSAELGLPQGNRLAPAVPRARPGRAHPRR
jgi:GMP synthase (glutamine-hydrolysing)